MRGVPALNIRNVSERLVKRLKLEAAILGVTLRAYVVERLENGGDALEGFGGKEVAGSPSPKEKDEGSGGVQGVRGGAKVRAGGRREPGSGGGVAGGKGVGERCAHGTVVGEYCGYCFGVARRRVK